MTDINDEWDKEFPSDKKRGKPVPLVEDATEEIMSKYYFLTVEETDEVWYYKDGVYVSGGEILIGKELERIYGYELDTAKLAQIVGHIKRRTYHKHEELDIDVNIINLKNGLYNIDKNELAPHDRNYLSVNQKLIIYDANAKAERFDQFLAEVLYERDIRTGIEAMAYTFERDCPIEVIFIPLGYGSNGKTVYTSTMTAMHGQDNVSNVPLSQMLSDKFALADLENKDVNIDNELGNQSIRDTAVLKRLTGGSRQRIRIQRKNQGAYDTIIYAKLFFNTNKIPDSEDMSDAYNRRIIIISFPHKFEGDKEDKQLLSKLTTEAEKSGIFNILMKALRDIRRNGEIYVNEKTIEERRFKYLRAHDSVKAFIEETIDWEKSTESESDHYVSKSDLHLVYSIYCTINRIPAENYLTFCKHIKKTTTITIDKEETQIMINETRKSLGEKDSDGNAKQTPCWTGIKLVDEYAKELIAAKIKKGQERLD
jgi:putative DNA primase/helicase